MRRELSLRRRLPPAIAPRAYQSAPWPVTLGMPVCANNPPSATMQVPLTYEDSSETRNRTTLAISLGSPYRPIGMIASERLAVSGSARRDLSIGGVRMAPGQTALQRIPLRAYSIAVARVRLITPALIALYAPRP